MSRVTRPELCTQCQHKNDAHVFVATTKRDPSKGGVRLCPKCNCLATWDVPQLGGSRAKVRRPGPQELQEIHRQVFAHPTDPEILQRARYDLFDALLDAEAERRDVEEAQRPTRRRWWGLSRTR